MKLHLINFRCYEDMKFDFGESGVTLISGPSGVGKTTIMMAINFVLFGAMKKMQTHNKKTCSVELILPYIKIFRKAGPRQLIVNDIYEDSAGEAIIREKFGKIFKSVSYISQDLDESFINMKPADKLIFLEKFATGEDNVVEIKERTKSLIKGIEDDHNKILGNLEFASKLLSETQKPEKVDFPIKTRDVEKSSKNVNIKYKNAVGHIRIAEREIKALETEKSDKTLFESLVQEKRYALQNIDEKIGELNDVRIDYIGDDQLEILKDRLKRFIDNRSVMVLRKQYKENLEKVEELKSSELLDMQKLLDQHIPNLWNGLSKTEIIDEITSLKLIIATKVRYNKLSQDLSSITVGSDPTDKLAEICQAIDIHKEKLETAKLQKEILKCPCCNNNVRFLNGSLVKSENIQTGEDTVDSLQNKLRDYRKREDSLKKELETYNRCNDRRKKIEDEIKMLDTVDDTLEDLETELYDNEQYKIHNDQLEQRVSELQKNIKSRIFSRTITSLEKKNNSLASELEAFEKTVCMVEDDINEENLRGIISEQTDNIKQINNVKKQIANYEKDKDKYNNSIKVLEDTYKNKYPTEKNIDDLIMEKTNIIKTNIVERDIQSELLVKIDKYNEYVSDLKKYENIESKVGESKSREIEFRRRLCAANEFRNKVIEAENKSIMNMIENINSHAQIYLDHFFPDNPISVKLAAFKESKSGDKPSINLDIDYRGIDHDLDMLSGGEKSRVILAFTLALADIYNSPLILLDECTASLDQDLTSSVIDGLKEHFSNKLVILIAHQVVQGAFDKVIKL